MPPLRAVRGVQLAVMTRHNVASDVAIYDFGDEARY